MTVLQKFAADFKSWITDPETFQNQKVMLEASKGAYFMTFPERAGLFDHYAFHGINYKGFTRVDIEETFDNHASRFVTSEKQYDFRMRPHGKSYDFVMFTYPSIVSVEYTHDHGVLRQAKEFKEDNLIVKDYGDSGVIQRVTTINEMSGIKEVHAYSKDKKISSYYKDEVLDYQKFYHKDSKRNHFSLYMTDAYYPDAGIKTKTEELDYFKSKVSEYSKEGKLVIETINEAGKQRVIDYSQGEPEETIIYKSGDVEVMSDHELFEEEVNTRYFFRSYANSMTGKNVVGESPLQHTPKI